MFRVSEGLALNWNDVDFKRKKLRVHHTLEMTNQKILFGNLTQKLKAACGSFLWTMIQLKCLKSGKLFKKNHGVEQFILSYTDLPLYRSTVQRIIQRYAKLAKVPNTRKRITSFLMLAT